MVANVGQRWLAMDTSGHCSAKSPCGRADLEALVEALDEKPYAGVLSWLTAGHVWRTVSKAFSDAFGSKQCDLRALAASPTAGRAGAR